MRSSLFLLLAATTIHTDFEGGCLGRIEKASDPRHPDRVAFGGQLVRAMAKAIRASN